MERMRHMRQALKKRSVWVLSTTDNLRDIGMKTMVSLHHSLKKAEKEMLIDIGAAISFGKVRMVDLRWDRTGLFVVSADERLCWSIEMMEVD